MNVKQIGINIAQFREAASLTQDELSDRAGVSYSTISKLERGVIKSPSLDTVVNIAKVLNISIDEIIDESQTSQENNISFVFADMNGVMVRFFQRAFVTLAEETGASAELIETAFWHYNDLVNRGEMTITEFNEALAVRINSSKKIDWKRHYLKAVEPITQMHDCLAEIKKSGLKIGLLTNTMPGFVDALTKSGQMPSLDYDCIIDSSVVETIKPEGQIYHIAQKAANVRPSEILFIDDSRTNLVAAEKHGWKVLWFDDYRPEESVKKVQTVLSKQ